VVLSSISNFVQISVIFTEIGYYALGVHLMTSHELTSGFDFLVMWSSPHGRGASAKIYIQSGVIDMFPKFKMAAAVILDIHVM